MTQNWTVPFTNFKRQYENYKNHFDETFSRIMSTGSFILRDDVSIFEESISKFLNVKHTIGVNSGSDALILAVKAHGIKPGDEVITVGHTYIMTLSAIVASGGIPVLVDIDNDFNIDVNQIEENISKKTKAILPVHINGRMAQMEKIVEIAQKYDLCIIEDSAQGLGAKLNNLNPGNYNSTGCFSLHPMKNLNCAGDGGFITTDNDDLAETFRLLRNHGQRNKYDYANYGLSSRLDTLQAALINVKFNDFPKSLEKRRSLANLYIQELKDLPIILPVFESKNDHYDVYSSFVIRTNKQQELLNYLRKNLIEVFVHLGPTSIPELKNLEFKVNKRLVNTEKISKEVLSLPLYQDLTHEEVLIVCNQIKRFFN